MSTANAMQNLAAGRTALVTGGNKGIGAAIALALAAQGADVAIGYRQDAESANATADRIRAMGRNAVAIQADVRETMEVQLLVDTAAEALGGTLDILVNNAGHLVKRQALAEMEDSLWHAIIDLNLTSCFLVTRAVLPYMTRGWGRIINIASVAAYNGGGPGAAVYATAKGGMISLTRGMAKEFVGRGITVNAVAPGFIDTAFHHTYTSPEAQEAMVAQTLVKRAGLPEDVAAAVLYLVSDLASFVTGEVIHVNGGAHFG